MRAPMSERVRSRFGRPLRFGIVGASGVVVNTLIVWLLLRSTQLPLWLASGLATEAAILTNFLLNDRWTFRDAGAGGWPTRLLRYNFVALGGLVITAGLFGLLVGGTGLALLPANLVAIGGATAWNYMASSRWTWASERRERSALR